MPAPPIPMYDGGVEDTDMTYCTHCGAKRERVCGFGWLTDAESLY